MTSKATGKPPVTPDSDPLDTTYYSVSSIEHAAKQVTRKALPGDRRAMWTAFTSGMQTAAEVSTERMPWEPPEVVSRVTARSARDALVAMLNAVPDYHERQRLAQITAREAEKVEHQAAREAAGTDIPQGKYPPQSCQLPTCGKTFRPKRPAARFCSDACRQAAYQARKAARQAHGRDAVSRDG